ncbi:MAG: hypothetical protein KGH94_04600 [Candidatus Micrarchaeota archaeon]|nr:hypothetical protein [Candidatus Micrarchaeota archaeon]
MVLMQKDDVFVVIDATPNLQARGRMERYVAVRAPRHLAEDHEFLRRRAANNGRASTAVFLDAPKKHDIGAVLEINYVRETIERERRLLRRVQSDKIPEEPGTKTKLPAIT